MAKIGLMMTALFVLTGCEQNHQLIKGGSLYQEFCIDGVVYLRATNYGGLTPKINADFMPYTCVEE